MTSIKIIPGEIEFLTSFASPSQVLTIEPLFKDYPAPLAFCGRSNVGKSSLINAAFSRKIAHFSKTPGRTQAVNIFRYQIKKVDGSRQAMLALDLPGHGHAEVPDFVRKNWQELMPALFNLLPSSTLLLSLMDARHPFKESEKDFLHYIHPFKIETMIVFTKWDKLKTQKDRADFEKKLKSGIDEWSKFLSLKGAVKVSVEDQDRLTNFIELLEEHLKTSLT